MYLYNSHQGSARRSRAGSYIQQFSTGEEKLIFKKKQDILKADP